MTVIQQAHRSLARFLLLYLLISILAACASLTEQVAEPPPDWEDRLQQLQQIDSWTIKARLGVQTETEGGSFDVFWHQQVDRYDIRLVAPMGQGAVHIVGDDGGVTISRADGRSEYSDNAEELFHAMTGLSLPVNGLHDWLRGIPIQHEAIRNISWNENGQLYKIDQTGWRVEMGRYKVITGHELPHAFYLEQEQRPELSVRLLVREWQPAQ